MINLLYIFKLCQNQYELKAMLQYWGLIPIEGEYLCMRCNNVLKLSSNDESLDTWFWWCGKKVIQNKKVQKPCTFQVPIRKGTIFSNSNLSLLQILALSHLWVKNNTIELIAIDLEINYETVTNWITFCNEVVLQFFLQNPQKIGGPDKIVEIYETTLGTLKYNEGQNVEENWVFGGFERGTGKIFMVTVKQHDSDTLISIIEEWVEKGTIILTDFLKSDNCLSDPKYKLLAIDHSITFKGAKCHAKAVTLSKYNKKVDSAGDLAKYLFCKKCDDLGTDSTEEYFKLAGKLYNPRNNEQNIGEGDEFYLVDGFKKEVEEGVEFYLVDGIKKENEEDDEFFLVDGIKKEGDEFYLLDGFKKEAEDEMEVKKEDNIILF